MIFDRMKMGLGAALVAGAALLVSPLAAQAKGPSIRVGTLTCEGQGGVGLIIGSQERLICTYQSASGRDVRHFFGTISRVGLDIGIKGKSIIVWGVLASSNQLPDRALVGKFAGVAADASLGLGAGAQVLLGGTRNSIVLQPLSVKGQVGVNLAIGVAGLTLVPQS
jgi:Protein of unknown function (DUF992)